MQKIPVNRSAGVRRKNLVRNYLAGREKESLATWLESNNSPLRTLASLLFDSDPLIQWRAIEALSMAAKTVAKKDKEAVRRQVRRLFWLMNDESGGLCWNAPEAIAEIIIGVPDLAGEYVPNLFSFMDEEPFEAGVRWAVYRLMTEYRDKQAIINYCAPHVGKIVDSLDHAGPRIRAYAILALGTLGGELEPSVKARLEKDDALVDFYDIRTGSLRTPAVREFLEI
jgi:hypothetical protein